MDKSYELRYTGEEIDELLQKALEAQPAEEGKGLSTEDYTTNDKEKLDNLPTNSDLQAGLASKITNPTGGEEGQVLTKTAEGEEWADARGGTAIWPTFNVTDGMRLMVDSHAGEQATMFSLDEDSHLLFNIGS